MIGYMKDINRPSFLTPGSGLPQPSPAAGAEYMWGGLTKAAWQALADPNGQHVLPTVDSLVSSDSNTDEFESQCHLWSAILDLLKYSFGWRSPAHGMAKWVETGTPTTDRRFEVIAHLLGRDLRERAVNLSAFLFMQMGWNLSVFGHGSLTALHGPDSSAHPVTRIPEWVQEEFRLRGCGDDAEKPVLISNVPLPCSAGGWDNMHLSGHCWAPIARTASAQGAPIRSLPQIEIETSEFYSRIDGERGTAVLVTHQYTGWFDDLVDFGDQLEPLPSGRSWRVDVVCRPIGWLGTFRKSRETGLWFSGPHSLHEWGEFR
jgi:hypothetical protein